jgi:hypothetical protein
LGYSYRGSRVIGRACRRLSTPSRGHRMFPTCSFQISLFSPEIGLVSSSDKSLFRVTTRWATGWGRAGRTETWATRISRSGTMPRPSSTTRRTGRLQRIKVGNRAGEGRALGVRAARQGPVAGADQAPGPIVTRRRRRAWMIECVRRQSGSRLPSMVVVNLQNCTWRTPPFMRAKRTRRWHISKSTSHGTCNGDVTLACGVGRRGARTRRCSRAAAAV